MGSLEPSALARLGALSRLTLGYAFGLVLLLQGYGLARGVLTGRIADIWLAVLPTLWFDVGLVVVLAFGWGLAFGRPPATKTRWSRWLVPDFSAIRGALRSPTVCRRVLTVGVVYAALIALLTGVVVIDPGGSAPRGPAGYPFLEVFDAPLGWGPKLVWAPDPFVIVFVRPYTAAAVAVLTVLAGFGVGLVGLLWKGLRVARTRNAAGAVAGLLVVCPTCAVSPTFALFAGILAPAASGQTVAVAGLAVGGVMAISTAMLLAAVVLLWVGIARTSRILGGAPAAAVPASPPVDRRSRLAAWALVAALVIALGGLLVDLSAAPIATHAGHGATGPTASPAAGHPSGAIGLYAIGIALAAVGLSLGAPGLARLRRSALVAGLTLLYADGIVHWTAILTHLGEPTQAWFFILSGAVQLAAVPLSLRRDRMLWWTGVASTVFFVVLFIVTRFVAPPFALEPEPVEALGLLSKGLEVGILAAMAVFFGRRIVTAGTRRVEAAAPASVPSK